MCKDAIPHLVSTHTVPRRGRYKTVILVYNEDQNNTRYKAFDPLTSQSVLQRFANTIIYN